MEFAVDPLGYPMLGFESVESFALSAGWLVQLDMSSVDITFSFDENGEIYDWFVMVSESEWMNDGLIERDMTITTAASGDEAIFREISLDPESPGVYEDYGRVYDAGVWVRVVPEPSMIVLWSLMGIIGASICWWRKHHN